MQQFWEAKEAYPDCLMLFRMGDFYETFYEDAITVARELGITLTARDKSGPDGGIPMAGVPHHSAKGYISKLVNKGYRVAICEQMEDPSKARGLVRREVVRVITPGVVLDDDTLTGREPNYLLAATGRGPFGLAYLDISTGEFQATEAHDVDQLAGELARIGPREVRLEPGTASVLEEEGIRPPASLVEVVDDLPDRRTVTRLLTSPSGGYGHLQAIEGFGFDSPREVARAAALVLGYVERTQKQVSGHVGTVRCYGLSGAMLIDETTATNLELFRTIMGGRREGSLLGLMDRTRTAMGARLLRRYLAYPLMDPEAIGERLDAVQDLYESNETRERILEILAGLADLERLAGRLASGLAGPRELVSLERSARGLPELKGILARGEHPAGLARLGRELDELTDLADLVERALVDDPPPNTREGGVFRAGYDPDLDELLELSSTGKDWIARMEAREREATGISSLKVKFNKVFGYFIEVTRPNIPLVPDHYIRKQTLANAERYYTPELKEWEEKVVTAHERRVALEAELFERLRVEVASHVGRIQDAARVVAELDVYAGLAELARRQGYVRPEVTDDLVVELEDARHPVVEAAMEGEFVPNSVRLDCDQEQLLIVTGPNMAGKSTVMRQTALVVLMAQVGSFVPATEAHVGVVDRIFARVGASDNLSKGRSTFMVEMIETANILAHATRRSLLILDEIGRGTSTFDGVSIAWAVAEHIHDRIGARTMFATHYHELTELAMTRERVRNMSIAVKEWQDEIVFLRKLVPGATGRSYGIQVGRLAGLPAEVVARAKEVLANLEATQLDATSRPVLAHGKEERPEGPVQLELFAPLPVPSWIEVELERLDLDGMSPKDALDYLYRLKDRLARGR